MRRLLLIAAGVALAAGACEDNNGTPGDGPRIDARKDGGGGSEVRPGDGPRDGPKDGPKTGDFKRDGARDGAKPCTATGAACVASAECCSGTCTNKLCAVAQCAPNGAVCKVATDCCNLNCTAGICGSAPCISDNQSCTVGGTACCSTQCLTGKCQPLNPNCATAGNSCGTTDGGVQVKCCSGQCTAGKCAAPSQVSYCTQVGDICYKDTECCTGVCAGMTATKPGTCAAIQGGGCVIDGIVCSGCNSCCSSFCAPFGLSGPHVCQPASGCHVMGDLCHKDSDCCGGDATQLGKIPGAGLVKCIPDPAYPTKIGTCSDPNPGNCPPGLSCGNACVPEGAACHYKGVGGCPSNSTRNDCCEAPGNKGKCQLDKLGVPRCYGLGACVPAGGDCASSADCCQNLPCVPDAAGHLKCGSTPCVPQGGICTTTSDCCAGMPCIVPPGSLAGICGPPPPPPPPPPSDAGPDKAIPKSDMKVGDWLKIIDKSKIPDKAIIPDKPPQPTCALYGQSCSTTVPCCANQGDCRLPYPAATLCTAGATTCTCYNPIL